MSKESTNFVSWFCSVELGLIVKLVIYHAWQFMVIVRVHFKIYTIAAWINTWLLLFLYASLLYSFQIVRDSMCVGGYSLEFNFST